MTNNQKQMVRALVEDKIEGIMFMLHSTDPEEEEELRAIVKLKERWEGVLSSLV